MRTLLINACAAATGSNDAKVKSKLARKRRRLAKNVAALDGDPCGVNGSICGSVVAPPPDRNRLSSGGGGLFLRAGPQLIGGGMCCHEGPDRRQCQQLVLGPQDSRTDHHSMQKILAQARQQCSTTIDAQIMTIATQMATDSVNAMITHTPSGASDEKTADHRGGGQCWHWDT